MATALKDIQFTTPMLVGAANASNGTTYVLGSADVLGPVKYDITLRPGDIASSRRWVFDGVAEYAKSAVYAQLAESAISADSAGSAASAYKATHIDFGSDSVHGLVAVDIQALPVLPFGSVTGSWSSLRDYLQDLNTVLQNISGKSVAVVDYDD